MFELSINVYGDVAAREKTIRRGSMNRGREEINLAKKMIHDGKRIDGEMLSDESRNLETFLRDSRAPS